MAKFISLFSGCGGIDLGMEQAGHECVAQVEWDKNAAGVLKHRWPNVPLFCDVSKVSADDLPDCDFITYGFPCQDVSQAGLRKGLDGKRSGLFFEACRIIKQLAERAIRRGGVGGGRFIAVAENVKGLLSSGDGYDFARCIRELHNIGASEVGWSVLDSQFFGVPQRRKRVFLVADFGGESTSEILAITESLPGHPPPSREAGKGTAGDATKSVGEGGTIAESDIVGTLSDGAHMGGGLNGQGAYTGRIMAVQSVDWYNQTTNPNINHTLGVGGDVPGVIEQKETYCLQGGGETSQSSQGSGVNKDVAFTLNGLDKHGVAYEQEGIAFEPRSADGEPRITGNIKEVVSPTLNCMGGGQREPSVVTSQQGGEGVGVATYDNKAIGEIVDSEVSGTITSNTGGGGETQNPAFVRENLTVRRLTPIECERLQGFPDNWTSEKMELILEGNEWKATGKVVKQADGPRYKAMGNAVTVNVAEYLGKQIGKVIL